VTEGAHVIFESRLQLARLLYADFDPSVRRVVAQPFLLVATVSGVERKHVPDYLLLTDTGPVIVDVKPASKLIEPKVAGTLAWTRSAIEERGWIYEVWTEPPSAELRNVRFLAGFRRSEHFDDGLVCELKTASLDDMSFGEASRCVSGWPNPMVRSALLHLVWTRYFDVDITRELTPSHVLLPGTCR
jgi:TnsA endonuclease N terminal